jgi:hypothetical protein
MLDRKSTTKAIAFIEKIDNMLQQIQIVVKASGKQIDREYPVYTKYAGTSFQSIVWMLIFDIVTVKRMLLYYRDMKIIIA